MKFFFFPIVFALSVFFACNNGKNTSLSDYGPLEKDTIRIAEIDMFVDSLYKQLQTGLRPSSVPFEFNADTTRSLSYYDLSNGMQLWDATVSDEGTEAYATFYLNDEEPYLFRYRAWDTVGTKIVQEIFMYFKNDKIFFAKDRSTPPGSNMNPSQLMQMPFHDSKKSKEELYGILNRYYPPMKKAWKNRK